MNATTSIEIKFYQSLGKLFYAIAISDKLVHEAEITVLKELIKSKWVTLDGFEDEFNEDTAYHIETVFDWLDFERNYKAEDSFNEFVLFKLENEMLFTEKRKQLIWESSSAIANAFSGKNKSEIIILARLKMVLKE